MKCSLGISDFLEEISSLSHFIVFLCFFALITEEGSISPCYSLELCIQICISFLSCAAVHGVAESDTTEQVTWLTDIFGVLILSTEEIFGPDTSILFTSRLP